ncbi:MAG: ATP-binding cassette domain-containing protein [Actinomycetota bacterium]|nr:ATP-binding cassette domain-containing protein [Actinomycetota bacterium]
MARAPLTPGLGPVLEFDAVGVRMPRQVRRRGGGRRQRLRRIAGETRRDEVWRLRGATFSVAEGESVAIVGGKGSGRETLLRLAAGTLIPDEGAVRRRVAVVPMIDVARALQRGFTIRQNIYFVGGLLGMTPDEAGDRVAGIAAFSGLEGSLDKYLGTAIPMVRQKLAWSISMATEARAYAVEQVLVVGERDFRQQCWTRVDQMRKDGVTFLLASDSPRQFRRFCDRAIVLEAGALVAQGTVPEAIALFRESRRRGQDTPPEEPETSTEESGGPL